jgi:hypothetical protein
MDQSLRISRRLSLMAPTAMIAATGTTRPRPKFFRQCGPTGEMAVQAAALRSCHLRERLGLDSPRNSVENEFEKDHSELHRSMNTLLLQENRNGEPGIISFPG